MSKELKPDNFEYFTEDLCEFVSNDYCHTQHCDFCPFYHTPGIAIVTLYRIKDKEDENND